MRRWRTASEAETRRVGAELAAVLGENGVLLLFGDLGSGKTVLTKGVAEALGIAPEEIQSPTFTVVHEHQAPGGQRLCHVDLYRLQPDQVDAIGLDELLAGPGIKIVEWAERLQAPPPGASAVELRPLDGEAREILLR